MSQPDQIRETRDPRSLKTFHLQEQIHGPLKQKVVNELAADIEQRGLQQPIEVLPDNTILCGHHRVAAALRLGLPTIPVIVRHDLATATPAEQRKHFVKDNLLRRNHGRLAQARMIVALDDILNEPDEIRGRHRDHRAKKLLEETGICVSGKTLDRWMTLLKLPLELQDLVDDGTIKQAKALKLLGLPSSERDEAAKQVLSSTEPAKCLDDLLSMRTVAKTKQPNVDGLAERFVQLCLDVDELDLAQFQQLLERITTRDLDPQPLQSLREVLDFSEAGTRDAA